MNTYRLYLLRSAIPVTALVVCDPAFALAPNQPASLQQRASAPATGTPDPTAAPEATATADQGSPPAPVARTNESSDVIVTARRTAERLQDVPISITVFNQQQLNNRNIVSANDLATYTPSLTSNARFGTDNAAFAIRGFTQEARTTASVGTYFAEVVAPRGGTASIATGDGAPPGSFFDLQNVQVLKGPQGTLFGRNTTGGAVLLVPQKPTDTLEGYGEASYGNYNMKRFQAVLNIPLGESARLRLGFDHMDRAGYLHNISGVGPATFADTNYWAGRASLVVDLLPTLENYTIASYNRSDNHGLLPQVQICNPANFPSGQLICGQIARRQASGDPYAVQSAIPDPRSLVDQWQVINTTTWRAGEGLTVKNIASYSQLRDYVRLDLFGVDTIVPASLTNPTTGAVIAGGALTGQQEAFNSIYNPLGGSIANQANFTEELQFQGNAFDKRLTWQAGGYLELSDPLSDNRVYSATRLICADRFSLQCVNQPGLTGQLTLQRFRASFHDSALYAQATFSITRTIKATGGIRYTWDTSRSFAYNVGYTFPAGLAPVGRCANIAIRPVTQPITDPTNCNETDVQKSRAPTWLLGLDYKPLDALLLYAKYSRGYRQGGVNPLAAGGFNAYAQERVDAYEIGAKAIWRGALPGFLNIAGFYNDLLNQQLGLGLTSTLGAAPNNAIVNVGKSRLKGVEVETGIGPVAGFRIDGSYAYIDARLLSTVAPVFPVGSLYNGYIPLNAGQPAPYTPRNKYSVTGTYTLPLPVTAGQVSIAGTWSHSDSQLVANSIYGSIPGFETLNGNLNWNRVAGSPIDLQLFATNLLNHRYAVSVNDMYASGAFVSYPLAPPRMYGARLRYSFGR